MTVIIDPGFHVNANPASVNYLIPTTLNVTNETPLRVIYPPSVSIKPKVAEQAIDVYEGRIQIIAAFSPTPGRAPYLFGILTVPACNLLVNARDVEVGGDPVNGTVTLSLSSASGTVSSNAVTEQVLLDVDDFLFVTNPVTGDVVSMGVKP